MARRTLYLIVGCAAFAALLAGGYAVVRADERKRIRDALTKWAVLGNLEPDYLVAIATVESGLRLNVVNRAGPDGARGGAYGPTQITAATAFALGFTGDPMEFARDPELAAQWTARILNDSRNRGNDLTTLADYVAVWNAGKDNADRNNNGQLEELPATHRTRAEYLPRAIAALNEIRKVA